MAGAAAFGLALGPALAGAFDAAALALGTRSAGTALAGAGGGAPLAFGGMMVGKTPPGH